MGDYKPRSVIMKVPSMWKSVQNERDTANSHALMSAPITCTLPLTDGLKIRPDLWESVAKCLTDRGFWNKKMTLEQAQKPKTLASRTKIQVPINKLGDKAENNEGNTTLPVLIHKIKSIAILDSGAGVGIATKQVWEAWGKPAIQRTRMNLQLADGSLESPLELLEDVKVRSCGIDYVHTFAIVDFGKETNYKVILG